MELKKLVQQASATYSLDVDQDMVTNQMRRAGFGTEISASNVERAVDMIISISEKTEEKPVSVYASLKVEAESQESEDSCPRCKTQMQNVSLVNSRKANYCQPCNITLPIKVEA